MKQDFQDTGEQQSQSQGQLDAKNETQSWHSALDLFYGFDIGELVEVEHEPTKYWLARIIYAYKNLLLLKWECDYGEFWLNCAQAGGKKRCYPPGHFMQPQLRSQYELRRPPRKSQACESPFGNIKNVQDLLLDEDDFEDTHPSGAPTCLADQHDQLKVTKSAKKRLLQKEDVEELEAALQILEGLDNETFDQSDSNRDTDNEAQISITEHQNSQPNNEISTQRQQQSSESSESNADSTKNNQRELVGNDNDIRDTTPIDLNNDASNKATLSVVNTAADPVVLTGSLDTKISQKDGPDEPVVVPPVEENAEERQKKDDEQNLEKCKAIRQQAIEELKEKASKLGSKPKQIYDLGGVNPDKVFIPGALLEICHSYMGPVSKITAPLIDPEPTTTEALESNELKNQTEELIETDQIKLECTETLENPKSPVQSRQFCHWFAFIVENNSGRLTLRWLLSDEPRFKQGRLESKSASCSFIEEDTTGATPTNNSTSSGFNAKNGPARPSSGNDSVIGSTPAVQRTIPSKDATFKMHYCHPAIHTIGKAQKLSRVYRIPNKLREKIISSLSPSDQQSEQQQKQSEENSDLDNPLIENIEKRLCDSVFDVRRINLDKDRPLIDYFLHIIHERRPAHAKKLNDSGNEDHEHQLDDQQQQLQDDQEITYNEDSADDGNKYDNINELISESAWCTRIYFNHKCFSGPALSKGKICSLPQYVGPGPLRLVMEEVVSKIISVAYVPPRILSELSGKNFEELLISREITNTSPIMFKAKYQKRVYREELPVIVNDSDVTVYCECICEHLKCCYNLFGPDQYSGDDCPGHCRGLTKSNKFMKRAIYYREKARMGEFVADPKKGPLAAVAGVGKSKNGKPSTSRPAYGGRDSQDSQADKPTTSEKCDPTLVVDTDIEMDEGHPPSHESIDSESQSKADMAVDIESRHAGHEEPSGEEPVEKKAKLELPPQQLEARPENEENSEDKTSALQEESPNEEQLPDTTVEDNDAHDDEPDDSGEQHTDIFSKDPRTIFNQLSQWTVDDVYEYVKTSRFSQFANLLRDQEIDGPAFLLLDRKVLREYFHSASRFTGGGASKTEGLRARLNNRLNSLGANTDTTLDKCSGQVNSDRLDFDELSLFIRKIGEKINLIKYNDADHTSSYIYD